MKKILAGILIIILFSTSSLLSEGYLCIQNLQALKLCKCNHSSEKELHSNTNDILLPEHTSSFKSNDELDLKEEYIIFNKNTRNGVVEEFTNKVSPQNILELNTRFIKE